MVVTLADILTGLKSICIAISTNPNLTKSLTTLMVTGLIVEESICVIVVTQLTPLKNMLQKISMPLWVYMNGLIILVHSEMRYIILARNMDWVLIRLPKPPMTLILEKNLNFILFRMG